jgi:hypothetical protein
VGHDFHLYLWVEICVEAGGDKGKGNSKNKRRSFGSLRSLRMTVFWGWKKEQQQQQQQKQTQVLRLRASHFAQDDSSFEG